MTPFLRLIGEGLASLWVTLAGLTAAAAVALAGGLGSWPVGAAMAIPLALLFVNLLAALATSRKLRSQGALLAFHLSLAAMILLVAADRLTALNGHVEVTEGLAFDPALVEAEAGPLHPWKLDEINFVQGPFDVFYAPGLRRRETSSAIHIPVGKGLRRRVTVGDDRPLIAGGYRLYTSFNKGFAPLLTYVDSRGVSHSGSIHLPSYPLNDYRQGNEWTLPGGGRSVKIWLHIAEPILDGASADRFRKPEKAVLVVLNGDQRHELRPGDALPLRNGRLRYEELRSWMGYTISYNPLTTWILAAAAIAVACLTWHCISKFGRMSWLRETPAGEPSSG